MPFKCRYLARDKASAKTLARRYDELPPAVVDMMISSIDGLKDGGPLGEGITRVVEVFAEGSFGDDMSNIKILVSYRLVL